MAENIKNKLLDIRSNIQPHIHGSFKPVSIKTGMGADWYAIYTRPCHEKEVYRRLTEKKIDAFLPLQTTIRQWSDRKKKVTVPLFSCYMFVNISLKDYYSVLNTPGIIRFISFNGKAVKIPEYQINLVKCLLEQDMEITEAPVNLSSGDKVKITLGQFAGMNGEMLNYRGRKRVIIRIDAINKSLLVSVPLFMLQLAG